MRLCNTRPWLVAVALGLALASTLRAQPRPQAGGQGASGDPVMLMNRAVMHYTRAGRAPTRSVWLLEYEMSIENLTTILERNPQDTSGRFLRALAYGQLASKHQYEARIYRARNNTQAATEDTRAATDGFRRMSSDIDELLKAKLTDQTAILHLLDGVVQTKLVGFVEGTPAQRAAARAEFLINAENAFSLYLNPPPASGLPTPTGFKRLRAEFFRAVVVYRMALRPGPREDAPDELVDPAGLELAGELMLALIDPASPSHVEKLIPAQTPNRDREVRRWLSYPTLYLGLIRTREGSNEAARRGESFRSIYDEARQYFIQAWQHDTGGDYPQQEERSGSRFIPAVVREHLTALDQAMEEQQPERTEDFFLDLRAGFAYDSNVILLGDNTRTPPDIGRKRDVRFDTGLAFGYTLDLGKINPELDRWSFGAAGRVSSLWHSDIRDFNEQDYGSSIAIQYKLVEPWSGQSATQGPVYIGIQYDYDYFLLDNDGFVSVNRISPRLAFYTYDQRAVTSLAFRYEDRDYQEPRSDPRFNRDGDYFAFMVSQSFEAVDMTEFYKGIGLEPWGHAQDPVDPAAFDPSDPTQDTDNYQRWLRPFIGVEYGWDQTRGTEFDAKRFLLAAGMEVPLPYGLRFDFGGEWEWQNYRHRSIIDFASRGRDALVQRYRFGLERRFALVPGHRDNRRTLAMDRVMMTLRGDVQLINDDSNIVDPLGQAIFSYDRAIYWLSVSFQFN